MIRAMRETDWPQVAAIYQQAINRGDSTFATELPDTEAWIREHRTECRLVAEENGNVIGWAMLTPTSSKPAYRGSVEVSVYLDEGWLGRGFGTALMESLIVACEKEGFWSLFSVIIAENHHSIALHKKCGFRIIGRREKVAKDRFGAWQDTILMERRSKNIF